MKNVIRVIILVVIMLLCCVDCHAETPKSNLQLLKETCQENYGNSKIKFIFGYSDETTEIIENRQGKDYIVVEIVVSQSNGNDGYDFNDCYITYNEYVNPGNYVISYCIYNPNTNYIDDITFVIDNQKVRQ